MEVGKANFSAYYVPCTEPSVLLMLIFRVTLWVLYYYPILLDEEAMPSVNCEDVFPDHLSTKRYDSLNI